MGQMIVEMDPPERLQSVFTWSLISNRPTNRWADGLTDELRSRGPLSDHIQRFSDVLKECVTD